MRIKSILFHKSVARIATGSFVFVLALLFRLVHFNQIYKTPLLSENYVPDTFAFIITAQKIIEGSFFYMIPMNMNMLYPIYLIPFILFFKESVLMAVFFQLMIDALSAAMVFRIALRVFDVKAALLAGALYALYGPLILFAGAPLAESLSIFFLLVSFYLLIKAIDDQRRVVYYYAAGMFLGLASLGRPNIIVSFVLLVGGMLFCDHGNKNRFYSVTRFALGLCFVLLPFSLNNYYLEKSFSPYPSRGGINFYIGNHSEAKGIYELIPGTSNIPYLDMLAFQNVASKSMGKALSLKESDAYWLESGVLFFAEHPVEALKLLLIKTLLFLNNKELATNLDYNFCRDFSSVLKYAIIPPGFLISLAVMGMILLPNGDLRIVLLKLFLIGLVLSTIFFFISERLRIISFPFMILLASQTIFILSNFIRRKEETKIILALLSTIALIMVTAIPLKAFDITAENTTSYAHSQYGAYLLNNHQMEEAVMEFKKAVELNSKNPEPYYHLSLIDYANKRYSSALEFHNKSKSLGFTVDDAYEKKLYELTAEE